MITQHGHYGHIRSSAVDMVRKVGFVVFFLFFLIVAMQTPLRPEFLSIAGWFLASWQSLILGAFVLLAVFSVLVALLAFHPERKGKGRPRLSRFLRHR